MKTISTLTKSLAGSLLLISILAGCKKDPPTIPIDIYTWDAAHTPAPNVAPDSTIGVNDANNNRARKITGLTQGH